MSASQPPLQPPLATHCSVKMGFYNGKLQRFCPMEWNRKVPLIGGIGDIYIYIIKQLARNISGIYKWYCSCQLGDYISPIPPIKGTNRNSYWYNLGPKDVLSSTIPLGRSKVKKKGTIIREKSPMTGFPMKFPQVQNGRPKSSRNEHS